MAIWGFEDSINNNGTYVMGCNGWSKIKYFYGYLTKVVGFENIIVVIANCCNSAMHILVDKLVEV